MTETVNADPAELARFEAARASSEELSTLFENPGVDTKVKKSITAAIGAKLAISELGLRVLDVFVNNDRINDLGAILDARGFLEARHGEAGHYVIERAFVEK